MLITIWPFFGNLKSSRNSLHGGGVFNVVGDDVVDGLGSVVASAKLGYENMVYMTVTSVFVKSKRLQFLMDNNRR